MNIIDWCGKEREVAAVVPTMDAKLGRVANLASELDDENVDLVFVEDSGPEFRFARSMNAGIRALLAKSHVKYILLSNDDVYNIHLAFSGMLGYLRLGFADYVSPYVNEKRPSRMFTRSVVKLVLGHGLRDRAPFYALRVARTTKKYSGAAKLLFSAPPLSSRNEVISVQPFCLFNRNVLEREMFDENFQNGVEDEELMWRLHERGYTGMTRGEWNVRHVVGASFRTLHDRAEVGSYYGGVEQFGRNMAHFEKKARDVSGKGGTK